jgi:hypothetical protein
VSRKFQWKEELELRLIDLWKRRCSYEEIARALKTTREAVAGKVYRLRREGYLAPPLRRLPYLSEYTGWKYVRDNPRRY